MASEQTCYHDDLPREATDIEVAREVEISREGQALTEQPCNKNPEHIGFIAINTLKLDDLPEKYRTEEKLGQIKCLGRRVVRLVVTKSRNGTCRKKREVGTGFVFKTLDKFLISTNNHIVRSQTDVENCKIEFNYDTYDRSNICISRGLQLIITCHNRDCTWFTFHPVPEEIRQLETLDKGILEPTTELHITYNDFSHEEVDCFFDNKDKSTPFLADIYLNNPDILIMFVTLDSSVISYLSSPFITFRQVPANIQELTDVEVHFDEENRVIPGEVIQQDDKYIVKVSELLQQDQVKNCKLVYNGEVVMKGGRLYFNYIDSAEYFSDKRGLDYEVYTQMFPDKVSLFNIKPGPEQLQSILEERKATFDGEMCIIGHPHGNIKTVTFGFYLGNIVERFDIHGRLIDNPEDDCSCKEVRCMKYSCKTCPGSCGSPIFMLNNLSDDAYNSHFMGVKAHRIYDGRLIENVNTAWCS